MDTAKRKTTAPKRKRPGKKKRTTARNKKAATAKAAAKAATSPEDEQQPAGPDEGGVGGGSALTDPAADLRRSDMAMVGAALRNKDRVPVRMDVVEAVLNRAGRIGLSTTKERNALAAARLLLTAVQINQSDEHKGLPDKIQVTGAVMTIDGQRAALLAAIAAEKRKRAAITDKSKRATG